MPARLAAHSLKVYRQEIGYVAYHPDAIYCQQVLISSTTKQLRQQKNLPDRHKHDIDFPELVPVGENQQQLIMYSAKSSRQSE